jgi:hypothetical protein
MEPARGMSRLFARFGDVARALLRRKKAPAILGMLGLSPSARGLTGRPTAISEHAKEVALEWEDVVEAFTENRMRELGIPEYQIGAPDYRRGGEKHAFLPQESIGGSNGTGRRLFLDAGILNPELSAEEIGPSASKFWAGSRLRDRIDAVIAHEYLEAQGIPHDEVVQRAPDTDLPIGESARRILRMIADGAKRDR